MITLGLGLFAVWFVLEVPIVVAAVLIAGNGEVSHGR